MRPNNLKTKIFLDGGDPQETKQTIKLLGFLDGQTTNPTLITKNPKAAKKLESGQKFTSNEAIEFYKEVVTEISSLIPKGSVSIEVYADKNTGSSQMITQGAEMFNWIPNAHVKFPTNKAGLEAAAGAVKKGVRVNMTLCFSQEQAAAVYLATLNAKTVPTLKEFRNVFISPFVGRLDDIGQNGMDLVKNIIKMYQKGDQHVSVLTASVRNLNHFLYALSLKSDIITAPFKVLQEWANSGFQIPGDEFTYNAQKLKTIPYLEIDLNHLSRKQKTTQLDITHQLTDTGIEKFSSDWDNLVI